MKLPSGIENPQGQAAPSPPPAGVKKAWGGPALSCERQTARCAGSQALRKLFCAAAMAAGCSSAAALVEAQLSVPVSVKDAYGKAISQDIQATTFHDDATPAPRPLLVLNHGRATDATARTALGRARFTAASKWFAERGFMVVVPTRVGYGVSGGEDVEDSGPCSKKNYPPGYAAAAAQVRAVIEAMRAQPHIDATRTVVMGQSYGGATAIAVAAEPPAGVVAAINLAGGGGGNPATQPREPCLPNRLERLFAGYGATARVPTLWVYTENDLFFGAEYPRQWFAAFKQAGGQGEFIQFPPHGEDGHSLFARFPKVWQPVVAKFLRQHGFKLED